MEACNVPLIPPTGPWPNVHISIRPSPPPQPHRIGLPPRPNFLLLFLKPLRWQPLSVQFVQIQPRSVHLQRPSERNRGFRRRGILQVHGGGWEEEEQEGGGGG